MRSLRVKVSVSVVTAVFPTGSNQAPTIINLDQTLQVREDAAVDSVIRTLDPNDNENVNKLTYTLAANPPANLAYFHLDGKLCLDVFFRCCFSAFLHRRGNNNNNNNNNNEHLYVPLLYTL